MTTPTKLKPVDAVVVGSGVVGSIICMELANAGLKVLCLERGRSAETVGPRGGRPSCSRPRACWPRL